MWKVVVRGIRETLERRVCRTNVYSQSSQDNAKNEVKTSLTCQQKFLPPVLITCDKGFCGSSKSTGANNSKHDSDWNTKHSWSEAVGWSSVLAAGWVVCQTLCLRKRVADRDSSETLKNKLHDYSSSILTQCLNLHPRKVLPVTNCTATSSKSSDLQDTESQWTAEKPFGPITIEEAAKYYTDAAAHNHADALYNLGVYHAQGKGGLPIDIDTARTCFNKAASLGQVRAQCALDSEKAEVKSKKTLAPNTNQKELEKIGEHFMPFKLSDHTLYSNVDDTFGTTVKSDQGLMGIVDLIKPFKFNPPPPIMINADYYVPY
ncbi:PREDICTED: uncharacterized protein LOC105566188 isoform X2 [Vollenhovia emeryi]|uniref:uncharacterized protein LOC105566188 isoform X2 n=1 Tax=Vollenhovia emeryi TaxID=411798 RepID=UPI0005F3C940|nr:PREDICTED: uncharacterized protein LOC105566188 isoform X2 [Vollenhovia emeryi]